MSSKTLYLGKFWGKDHNGNDVVRYINRNSFVCDTFEYAKTNATDDVDLLEYECKRETNFYTKELGWSNLKWDIIPVGVYEEPITENKVGNNNVNHPKYYNQYPKETIDIMIDTFGVNKVIDWCVITAFKYRQRMGLKGNLQEDFDKEQWYLNKAEELKKQLAVFNKDPLYDKHCEEEKQAYTLYSDIKEYVICDLEYNLLFTGNLEECREYYRRVFYGDISKAYFLDRQLYIDGAIKRNILLPKSE